MEPDSSSECLDANIKWFKSSREQRKGPDWGGGGECENYQLVHRSSLPQTSCKNWAKNLKGTEEFALCKPGETESGVGGKVVATRNV